MKNKRILVLVLSVILLIICLVGCGGQKTTENYIDETEDNYDLTTENNTTEDEQEVNTNNTKYYSFLKLDGDSLSFNFTVDEFINNYNRVKSSYDTYKDIEESDFVFIDSSVWSDENTYIYGCPLTILGRNNGIMIMLEIGENTNDIKCISLGIQDYVVYQNNKEYMDKFEIQYSLLIQALGMSYTETSEILSDMAYNESTKGNYGLYTNGLALFYATESNCAYYRISSLTEEQAKNSGTLKDVIKN